MQENALSMGAGSCRAKSDACSQDVAWGAAVAGRDAPLLEQERGSRSYLAAVA